MEYGQNFSRDEASQTIEDDTQVFTELDMDQATGNVIPDYAERQPGQAFSNLDLWKLLIDEEDIIEQGIGYSFPSDEDCEALAKTRFKRENKRDSLIISQAAIIEEALETSEDFSEYMNAHVDMDKTHYEDMDDIADAKIATALKYARLDLAIRHMLSDDGFVQRIEGKGDGRGKYLSNRGVYIQHSYEGLQAEYSHHMVCMRNLGALEAAIGGREELMDKISVDDDPRLRAVAQQLEENPPLVDQAALILGVHKILQERAAQTTREQINQRAKQKYISEELDAKETRKMTISNAVETERMAIERANRERAATEATASATFAADIETAKENKQQFIDEKTADAQRQYQSFLDRNPGLQIWLERMGDGQDFQKAYLESNDKGHPQVGDVHNLAACAEYAAVWPPFLEWKDANNVLIDKETAHREEQRLRQDGKIASAGRSITSTLGFGRSSNAANVYKNATSEEEALIAFETELEKYKYLKTYACTALALNICTEFSAVWEEEQEGLEQKLPFTTEGVVHYLQAGNEHDHFRLLTSDSTRDEEFTGFIKKWFQGEQEIKKMKRTINTPRFMNTFLAAESQSQMFSYWLVNHNLTIEEIITRG
jgi:hypothetical protein